MPITTENDDGRALEDKWRETLQKHGVNAAKADDIVKLTFGTPALKRDIPDIDDVPDIVEESLENTQFEQHLDDDANPERVKSELMNALKAALAGDRGLSAPVAVSDATLAQQFEPDSSQFDSEISPGTNPDIARPDTAAAYKSATRESESDLEEKDLDTLSDVLETLINDHDLEYVDMYAALEHLESKEIDRSPTEGDIGAVDSEPSPTVDASSPGRAEGEAGVYGARETTSETEDDNEPIDLETLADAEESSDDTSNGDDDLLSGLPNYDSEERISRVQTALQTLLKDTNLSPAELEDAVQMVLNEEGDN